MSPLDFKLPSKHSVAGASFRAPLQVAAPLQMSWAIEDVEGSRISHGHHQFLWAGGRVGYGKEA